MSVMLESSGFRAATQLKQNKLAVSKSVVWWTRDAASMRGKALVRIATCGSAQTARRRNMTRGATARPSQWPVAQYAADYSMDPVVKRTRLDGSSEGQAMAQLLQECPRLLQLLPVETLPELLGCSSHLRQSVHSLATTARINNSIAMFVEGGWHSLQDLTISRFKLSHSLDMQMLSMGAWPQLRRLVLRGNTPSRPVDSQAIAFLVQGNWPQLESLDLSLNKMSADAMAHLGNSRSWPNLKHLELQRCSLTCSGLRHLALATWPQLESLDLKGNTNMTGAVVAELCKGDWPMLQLLVLGSGVEAAGLACITQNWSPSMQQLGLQRAHFSPTAARYFSCTSWPNLTCLQLYKCSVTAAGLQWLLSADLPQLELLDLTGNALGADGFAALSSGRWSALQTLVVAETRLDAVAMLSLSTGSWPALRMLDCSGNDGHIDLAAVTHFASGRWSQLEKLSFSSSNFLTSMVTELVKADLPLLRALDLSDCCLCVHGVQQLTTGEWPNLQCLSVDLRPGEDVVLLGLIPQKLTRGAHDVDGRYMMEGRWPFLQLLYVGRNSDWFDGWELPNLRSWFKVTTHAQGV